MKRNILMVVDYQNDFVKPTGKLAIPDADSIQGNIQSIINMPFFSKRIMSFDTHPSKDIYEQTDEFQDFGFDIHCEFGTDGWDTFNIKFPTQEKFNEFIEEYKASKDFTKDKKVFSVKEIEDDIYFTKDKFDIWTGNEDFPNWIEKNLNPDTDDIYVVGVATNYCVFMNAIGFVKKGFNVKIVEEATKAIPDDSEVKNQNILKNRNVKFISVKDIV